MTLSVTCGSQISAHTYNWVEAGRRTPSSASHCFMTSGAITPVHVAAGMKCEAVAGPMSLERCAPQATSRIQFAGEPMTCT